MGMDFLGVGLLRLIVPLLILKRPLPGILLAAALDGLDWQILRLEERPAADRDFYQRWDKALDTYYLGLAALVMLRWEDKLTRNVGLILFVHRTVGVAVFQATGSRDVLPLFTNVFENYFIFCLLYKYITGEELSFTRRGDLCMVLAALLAPQMAREVFLHVLEDRPWSMLAITSPAPYGQVYEQVPWLTLYLAPPVFAMTSLLKSRETVREARVTVDA